MKRWPDGLIVAVARPAGGLQRFFLSGNGDHLWNAVILGFVAHSANGYEAPPLYCYQQVLVLPCEEAAGKQSTSSKQLLLSSNFFLMFKSQAFVSRLSVIVRRRKTRTRFTS